MTLTEAREFSAATDAPDFLDKLSSHACGASDVAIIALSALEVALAEVDRLHALASLGDERASALLGGSDAD